GPDEAGERSLSAASAGHEDVFVARFRPDGTLAWVKRAGGTGSDPALGIAATPGGSCWVTGSFEGTAIFGPGEAGERVLDSSGLGDAFVARYNADGSF